MKKIILAAGIMILALKVFSINPPAVVQKAFNQQFAEAGNVKWSKENATEYEAEFVLKGVKMSANYTADGDWIETETEISVDQIPAIVNAYLTKKYSGWEIVGASKIETSEKGIFYEADLKSGSKKKEVTVTSDGEPVN